MLVEKFARKFLDDPSYQTLVETMDKADYEEAFRAAHTLKGVCANLGFTQLFKVSSDLTEELRGGNPDAAKLPEMSFSAAPVWKEHLSQTEPALQFRQSLYPSSISFAIDCCSFHCWKEDRLF